MEGLADSALTQEERFLIATRRLGDTETLANEFAKVNRKAIIINRLLWMAVGVLLFDMLSLVSSTLGLLAGFFVTYLSTNGYYWGVSQLAVKGVCIIAGFFLFYWIYKTGILSRKVRFCTATRKRKCLFSVGLAISYTLLIISSPLLYTFIYSVGKYNKMEEFSRMLKTTSLSNYIGTLLLFVFLLIFVVSKLGKTQKT
jgi:hypothetical protein